MITIDSTIGIMATCGAQLLGHASGRLLCVGEPSLHHVRVDEEVQVVRVVHHSVHAIRRRRSTQIAAIGRGAVRVGLRCRGVVARAGVDMGRHVEQMAGRLGQRREALRARERARRRARRLDRVNVVVIRAEVIGVPQQHGFQHAHDLLRCSLRERRRRSTASRASGSSGFRRR